MLKESIKKFKISIGGRELGEAETPLSVMGALSSLGVIDDVYAGINAKKTEALLADGCILSSSFSVDALIYSQRRILLSLFRVDSPCTVSLNGATVLECDGSSREWLADIKDHLLMGDNTLTVSFAPKTSLADHITDRLSSVCLGGCELVCYNEDVITGVEVNGEMCEGFVRLHVSVKTLERRDSVRAVVTIVSPGGRIYYCGVSGGHGSIDITEPNLWWPLGYGVQNLYKLTANLYCDEEIVDSVDMRIGLKDARLSEWDGEGIPSLTVNGVPIFTRGAAYVSDDLLLPHLDAARVKRNLRLLADMRANTVLVRDVGVFPSDSFFKICDEEGLVAWIEIKAGGNDKLRREIEVLEKLSYHVSFGPILCESADVLALVKEIMPSSNAVLVENVDNLFIRSRESLPEEHTLLSVTPREEMNIFSESLEYHSTLSDNISLIESKDFRFPSGIHDVHCVTSYIEGRNLSDTLEWRRRERRSDLGVLLPRFNDPWPTVSRSVVDYCGRRKPHYYLLKRLFAPVMISAFNEGTRVTFCVSNELKNEYTGKFSYSVITNKGDVLFKDEYEVKVAEQEAMDILSVDLAEIIGGRLDECFVSYSVSDSFVTTSKGTLLFTSPKQFKFLKPTFTCDVSGSGTDFVLSVSSDVPCDMVHFTFGAPEAVFEDNYIFIDDSSPRRIELKTSSAVAIEVLRRELRVRSIYDLGRE